MARKIKAKLMTRLREQGMSRRQIAKMSSKLSRYHQSPSLVPPISKERYRE